MIRTTYTYALMDVSEQTYYEIYDKLREAGYHDSIVRDDGHIVLDMHGIALRKSIEQT